MTAALALADAIADRLADPDATPLAASHRQHLAYGPAGIALLHIEQAASGRGPWRRAHAWLAAAAHQPFTSGPHSHPFYGASAFAHVLACAADHLPGSYQRALDALDAQVAGDVCRRLGAAHRRIDSGRLPALAEFDVIRGLSGYGAYLLRRNPASAAVHTVLDYCVRLTEPISHRGETVPGWWTKTGPSGRPDNRFLGGHANMGVAHGIAGVLALLALAAEHKTLVDGHLEALRTILAWLDRWQEEAQKGPSWPYWVTLGELRTGRAAPAIPRRPSWCYGTAGLARAQQLAALALRDATRQADAENALVGALTDPAQLQATADNGLWHGKQPADHHLEELVATYLGREVEHGTTVFDTRLGLTVLDAIGSPETPAAARVTAELYHRTMAARDGYAAREVLAHPTFTELATSEEVEACHRLLAECALGAGSISDEAHTALEAALQASDRVIRDSVAAHRGHRQVRQV
ncbi:lanthionine synthetase LanC family protein [Streptomyces sp. HMX112]|uniref:lanthionine synthetase LanC family protein n=1 Tax=Streptomyces sp. HMX112 TaxID=3390850 RepID=UPI003A80DC0A